MSRRQVASARKPPVPPHPTMMTVGLAAWVLLSMVYMELACRGVGEEVVRVEVCVVAVYSGPEGDGWDCCLQVGYDAVGLESLFVLVVGC